MVGIAWPVATGSMALQVSGMGVSPVRVEEIPVFDR